MYPKVYGIIWLITARRRRKSWPETFEILQQGLRPLTKLFKFFFALMKTSKCEWKVYVSRKPPKNRRTWKGNISSNFRMCFVIEKVVSLAFHSNLITSVRISKGKAWKCGSVFWWKLFFTFHKSKGRNERNNFFCVTYENHSTKSVL